ncbi:MAG: hypothetical protein ABIE22_04180 [archaeon]
MSWKKINRVVSYYEKPVLGEVNPKIRCLSLSTDKSTLKNKIKLGLARKITHSQGNVDIPGFIDEGKLIIVSSLDLLNWKKVGDLKIYGIKEFIKKLSSNDKYFIGLEDPDIFVEKDIKHVYFTIAFKYKKKWGYEVFLGHAQGSSLDNLTATTPSLSPLKDQKISGFKECSISPVKTKEERFALNEALLNEENKDRSIITLSKIEDISKEWKFLKILLDPHKQKFNWCKGHLSPCRFIGEHKNLLVGIINGREPSKIISNKKIYRKFRPGLILFNPQTGEIPWISEKHLFEDPDATTITFASDFIQTEKDKGILFCHVNDSFVRAYKLNLKEIKNLLP